MKIYTAYGRDAIKYKNTVRNAILLSDKDLQFMLLNIRIIFLLENYIYKIRK